jgi:hypothetical protein
MLQLEQEASDEANKGVNLVVATLASVHEVLYVLEGVVVHLSATGVISVHQSLKAIKVTRED